jgi:hypothetical protein
MSPYWCAECGLPAGEPEEAGWRCWACCGWVISKAQLWYWNNLSFKALLDERLAQLHRGESVELADFGRRVKFAAGAASDYLLLEALGRDA